MDGQFHLSKLRCEPVTLHPEYGPPEGYTYWRVFVDEILQSDAAQPFTAIDPIIELRGNKEVPVWGDGGGYVSVRQIGPYVIWRTPIWHTMVYYLQDPFLQSEAYIVFDSVEY